AEWAVSRRLGRRAPHHRRRLDVLAALRSWCDQRGVRAEAPASRDAGSDVARTAGALPDDRRLVRQREIADAARVQAKNSAPPLACRGSRLGAAAARVCLCRSAILD